MRNLMQAKMFLYTMIWKRPCVPVLNREGYVMTFLSE